MFVDEKQVEQVEKVERTSARRQREHRERLREAGLEKLEIWIPASMKDEVKAFVQKRMKQNRKGKGNVGRVS